MPDAVVVGERAANGGGSLIATKVSVKPAAKIRKFADLRALPFSLDSS